MLREMLSSVSNRQIFFIYLLAGLLVYSISLGTSLFGDEIAFIERTQINSLSDLTHALDFKDFDSDYYRPAVNFLNGLLSIFFGNNILPYRIFNAMLHGFNAFVVFFFSMSIINSKQKKYISLTAGFFFLLFPIHDLAVIWHTDLFDRLLLPFYFLTIIFFIKNGRRHPLTFFFFLLALLSKEMSFSLPLALILIDHFINNENWQKIIKDTFPYFLLLIAFILLRYILFDNNILFSDQTHPGGSVFLIIKNLTIYFGILIFPFFTDSIQIFFKANPVPFIAAALVIITIILYLFYKSKAERNIYLFLFLLCLVILIPASRLVMQWYTYLPSVPILIIFSITFFQFSKRIRVPLLSLLLAAYSMALITTQINWVKLSHRGDDVLTNFKGEFLEEIKNSNGITFVTTPAKINGYPIFQLDFGHHLQFHLGVQTPIGILSRCNINSFDDRIECEKSDSEFELSVKEDNYFVLYGIEKNYNFDGSDFNNGLLQKIRVKLSKEEKDRLIFTYSEGQFKRID